MSTETLSHTDAAGTDAGHDAHGETHHPGDVFYWKIFATLVVITAAEVSLSYMSIGHLFLPLMLTLMTTKFIMVVSFFMHLKFDNKVFSYLFYAGLILAMAVYMVALTTAQFWTK